MLNALACNNTSTPPIWLMRQAGRYQKGYREIRAKHSLFDLFHNKELIVEITKLPVKQLGVDAAILFSDILSVLDAFGLKWDFKEGVGPILDNSLDEILNCKKQNSQETYPHISWAIKALKSELKVPLIGFAGGPFTVASYLIEKGSSRDLSKTKQLLYSEPKTFFSLLDKITDATIDYLKLQTDSGADVIQIFDSWAGLLTPSAFKECSLRPIERIIKACDKPVIVFARGSSLFAKEIASIKPAAISLDWQKEIATVRQEIPSSIALQGNLDPCILLSNKQTIRKEVMHILKSMQGERGYIFNLGHGVLPQIPEENVRYLVELVKSL